MKTGYSFGSLASFVETINNTTVKLTGNQTIAGIKTFSSNPISSAAQGTGGSHLTRKDYVDGALALKAPLASPALSGTPTAPTAAAGTNTTQLATTAFVQTANAADVKITGNQTIAGIKTFSSNPVSSAAQGTGGSHLTRKDYVDGRFEFTPIIADITVSSIRNYRFMAPAIATLPSSGDSIRFIVDHSVDLKSGNCVIQAPAGETIVAPRGSDNQVRIKQACREFVFVRINNQWRVS